MIIAAVKLSDIELDVDAETGETKRKRSWAGGFLRDIYNGHATRATVHHWK